MKYNFYSLKIEILNPNPETQFKWYHNDNLIENLEDNLIETNANDSSSLLKLRNLKIGNSGKYCCRIKNNIGITESFCNIKIITKPKFVRPLSNVEASDGDNIVLNCESSGIPEPKIIWYKDAQPYKPILGSSVSYEKNECILTILNATISNSGEYKCKAVNKAGFDEVIAIVTMKGNIKTANVVFIIFFSFY